MYAHLIFGHVLIIMKIMCAQSEDGDLPCKTLTGHLTIV